MLPPRGYAATASVTPYTGEDNWPVRVDQRTKEEPEHWGQSACVLCSNGCGCDIGVKDGRIVGVHGWEANNSPGRLTWPMVRRNGRLERATMPNTDTVLWMRVLDRRRHAEPPKLIVIDPRRTMTAREADLHQAPEIGTNVAVLKSTGGALKPELRTAMTVLAGWRWWRCSAKPAGACRAGLALTSARQRLPGR